MKRLKITLVGISGGGGAAVERKRLPLGHFRLSVSKVVSFIGSASTGAGVGSIPVEFSGKSEHSSLREKEKNVFNSFTLFCFRTAQNEESEKSKTLCKMKNLSHITLSSSFKTKVSCRK